MAQPHKNSNPKPNAQGAPLCGAPMTAKLVISLENGIEIERKYGDMAEAARYYLEEHAGRFAEDCERRGLSPADELEKIIEAYGRVFASDARARIVYREGSPRVVSRLEVVLRV